MKFKISFKYIVFPLTLTLVIVLNIFSSLGHALDWNDKSWVDLGCPKNILGTWISQDQRRFLTFKGNRVFFRSIEGDESFSIYKRKIKPTENRFIEITINQKGRNSKNKPTYLKIRPHLAFINPKPTSSDCFIKVFHFNSKKDSKFNKYISWTIYKKNLVDL